MTGRLTGKVAVITGVEMAIAAQVAHQLVTEDAAIVVNAAQGYTAESLTNLLHDPRHTAIAYSGDLSQASHALNCVQSAIDRFGRIDLLVMGLAASSATISTEAYPLDELYQLQRVMRSTFLMTKYALPYLQTTQGSIITIGAETDMRWSSFAFSRGSAMKAWLRAFTQQLAVEQAESGVRANCFWSEPMDNSEEADSPSPETDTTWADLTLTAAAVPSVCSFLASSQGDRVTGALYPFHPERAVLVPHAAQVAFYPSLRPRQHPAKTQWLRSSAR